MKNKLNLPKSHELTLSGVKYEIVKYIGHGGSSMVYSAMSVNGPVVIKELFPKELRGKLGRGNYEAGDMFLEIPPEVCYLPA